MNHPFLLRIDRAESYVDGMPAAWFGLAAVLFSLGVSLFFFAPAFKAWDLAHPNVFETARAATYLLQCDAPTRSDIEPAMRWRLLPPLLCHALGLRGFGAFAIPWAGVVALLASAVVCLRRQGLTRLQVLCGVSILATTSAVIVPIGWLGINDAWVWLGLLVTTLARASWPIAVSCLLLPWVDERFIIGFPLALAARSYLLGHRMEVAGLARSLARHGAWLLPYVAMRLMLKFSGFSDPSEAFFLESLRQSWSWLPYAPLGWWMAFRGSWFLIGVAVVRLFRNGRVVIVIAALTLLVSAVLAMDLSRSAAILLPLLLLGTVLVARWPNPRGTVALLSVLALDVLLPATHVVRHIVDVIWPLPFELLRVIQ